MDKLYERIDFVNNTNPYLNAENLNAMSKAIDDIDDRVIKGMGSAVIVSQIVDEVKALDEEAKTYAEASATSASESSASATEAKTSEDNAKASETASATSEANAKTSEDNAKTSETNASTSETNAKASEESASGYASQVETRAQEILSWETKAQEYAESAEASATSASTSATNAETSATNAEASAVKAENYAKQASLIGAHLTINTTTASFDGLEVSVSDGLETVTGTFSDGSAVVALHYVDAYTISVTNTDGRTYTESVTVSQIGEILTATINEHFATINLTTTSEELTNYNISVSFGGEVIDTTQFTDSACTYKVYEVGDYTFTCTYDSSDYSATISVTELDTSYSGSIALLTLVPFATATDEELATMLDEYYSGKSTLADVQSVWSVGDTRTGITLSAMEASGTSETHAEQEVSFTIVGFNHDDLVTPINGITKALVTLSQTDCLNETGHMNSSYDLYTYARWSTSQRHTWMSTYKSALPSSLSSLIKTVSKLSAYPSNSSNTQTLDATNEDCFLFSNYEMFGTTYSSLVTVVDGTQYEYFKTQSNRIKKLNGSGQDWMGRSGCWFNGAIFVNCLSSSVAGGYYASGKYGISPAFCL